jgi:hypothetical protein
MSHKITRRLNVWNSLFGPLFCETGVLIVSFLAISENKFTENQFLELFPYVYESVPLYLFYGTTDHYLTDGGTVRHYQVS